MTLYEYIKSNFSYSPDTGKFTRIKPTKGSKVGVEVGSVCGSGYVYMRVQGKLHMAHRLAWLYVHGALPTEIDHINNNRSDNRISNLRECTHKENMRNIPKRDNCTSKYIGVHWDSIKSKWISSVKIDGKKTIIGIFNDEKKAAKERDLYVKNTMKCSYTTLNFAY